MSHSVPTGTYGGADAAVARAGTPLPERAAVHWRPLTDERGLRRAGRLWTLSALAHTLPFVAAAVLLMLLQPLAFPVAFIALAHAWVIPELYAQRGGNVVRPRRAQSRDGAEHRDSAPPAEAVALGLLGDLVGHEARALLGHTGLVIERGRFGVWLVGATGALLVRPGGRRVLCYCVRVAEPDLPVGDRIAHLLLALRCDEAGFATVANLAWAGARWRLRRRLVVTQRPALAAAVRAAVPGAS